MCRTMGMWPVSIECICGTEQKPQNKFFIRFDLYGSVRSNSCKDMVNQKNIRFSTIQHTAVSQLTGAKKRTCKKTLVLLLLFEGSRVPQGSSEKKQAGGGDGGAMTILMILLCIILPLCFPQLFLLRGVDENL